MTVMGKIEIQPKPTINIAKELGAEYSRKRFMFWDAQYKRWEFGDVYMCNELVNIVLDSWEGTADLLDAKQYTMYAEVPQL